MAPGQKDTQLQLRLPYRDLSLSLASYNMDTDLGTGLTSTADCRGRLEEVQNFLADFEDAFNKGLQFDSSLHGQDDPNIVIKRACLH